MPRVYSNFQDWLAAHSDFKQAVDIVSSLLARDAVVYIITTKAKEFTLILLDSMGLKIPIERVFGLESGPKVDVLKQLIAHHAQSEIMFIEDRLETLEAVKKAGLAAVTCILVDWGYNTAAQRDEAGTLGLPVVHYAGLAALVGLNAE